MSGEAHSTLKKSGGTILPILETKLYIPQPRPHTVSRIHLNDQIQSAIQANHRLILISAPAGFGKSTLLIDWAAETDCQIAWYSLDDGDNDRTRFLTYLITSLQKLNPEIGSSALGMQQSPQPPPLEDVLTALINDLLDGQGHIAIVLDDYHLVVDKDIHRTVEFLLDHVPPGIHFILASRSDPPFSIARLRVRNTLSEMKEQDLRFRNQEAVEYLNSTMGLELSSEEIRALEDRTEGWIAGLQMAALSMQSQDRKSHFIQSLSGTNRFVLDYLIEEVLETQPAVLQSFMLQTSILDQLSGPLCEYVLGPDFAGQIDPSTENELEISLSTPGYGQSMLELLDRHNLFILPLDDERHWYRYHQLFSELLQNQLSIKHSASITELNRRASEWYESNGLLSEAVRHALASADHERAAELVGQNALALVYQGNLTTLARWLDALPAEVKRTHPWLNIAHAWALTFAGQLDQVAGLIQAAEEALDAIPDPVEQQRISGIIDALRAYLLAIRGSMSLAAEFAREALKLLPDDDLILRGFSAMLLATVLRWNGDLSKAISAYQEAIAINQNAGDYNVLVESLCEMAELQALHGELEQSLQTSNKALEIGSSRFTETGVRLQSHGYAHIRMSDVLRERNELDRARMYALEGLALVEDWGQADLLLRVYLELARVLQAYGEEEAAQAALRDAMRLAVDLSPWYVARVEAQQATVNLLQGKFRAALQWADEKLGEASSDFEFQNIDTYLALIRSEIAAIRLAHGDREPHPQILVGLDKLLSISEQQGAKRYLIEALILQTLLYDEIGDHDQSRNSLQRALEIGEKYGFRRVFIDESDALEPLLLEIQLDGHGENLAYLQDLILACRSANAGDGTARDAAVQNLIEPLSERELEVLGYLETHLTSNEIADTLCIAVSTTRSHIKSIYTKLSVHNRNDAVLRAQELDLL